MRRLLLMPLLFAATAAWPDDSPVTLDVQPLLCIVDRRTPACEMDFLIDWQSRVAGAWCLYNRFEDSPLRCWANATAGRHEEQREVSETFEYWMTGEDDEEPLAVVTVEVMSADAGDRRRRRQSRHVWDIL